MRVKELRGRGGAGVLLVYPKTLDEYCEAIEAPGGSATVGNGGPVPEQAGAGPPHGPFVVTTAEQRDRWDLPDLAASRGAPVVYETQALDLLCGTARPEAADEPAADGACDPAFDAVRAAFAPGTRIAEALRSLEGAGLPPAVRNPLWRDVVRALGSPPQALDAVLERVELALSLPWRTRVPERFDRAAAAQALDRAHGGHARAKARLLEALTACPHVCGPLTVEGRRGGGEPETGAPLPLVMRPDPPGEPAPVPCLAGPRGTGKTSLTVAAAAALGRPRVRVPLGGGDAERWLRGRRGDAPGDIVRGLLGTGVRNPVVILEAVDHVDGEKADALLDVLDPARRATFRDDYLRVPIDLSAVVWVATATDAGAVPEAVRHLLAVIEMPGYTEDEKLAIARSHLLTRPWDGPDAAGRVAPEPGPPTAGPDSAADAPVVVLEREVGSMREVEALAAGRASAGVTAAWRTAACDGSVRFEPEALRRVVRDHTDEAGVAQLDARLAAVCRRVVWGRPPGSRGPDVVTEAVVRDVLGDGAADNLPPAVRAAIAAERRRLGGPADDGREPTNNWIDWLERLPWTRRAGAPIDLAQVRAALDAAHAGLDDAKACLIEHLAVRRRNPRGSAVLCFAGPPGVGKTTLAQCLARALGRGFVKLACGGLRDESDLRGHNRTWKDAQPGWILRELRRLGGRNPVFVLDELDKIDAGPAAVLLEVLDPAQQAHFRDAFVEVPFDLSEVLFIATANEPHRILPALRDRLEVVGLPGYAEDEKVAIAQSHLLGAENREAGLEDSPVRVTKDACRRIIRGYTSEPGVRQLARCFQTICRKVALGLETGDTSRVLDSVTAAQVPALLGPPRAEQTDGLDRLRADLDASALPEAVRARGREVIERLSERAPHDPERVREEEYLDCLKGLPWTARTAETPDLARAEAVLDAGHAGHGAVKQRLLDYVAGRRVHPDLPSPVLCLTGPSGVGKTALARLLAEALGRACAWVHCGGLAGAAALSGARADRPGCIVDELRRVRVSNPVFVLDELDRLDEAGGGRAALLELLDPAPGAGFRDTMSTCRSTCPGRCSWPPRPASGPCRRCCANG